MVCKQASYIYSIDHLSTVEMMLSQFAITMYWLILVAMRSMWGFSLLHLLLVTMGWTRSTYSCREKSYKDRQCERGRHWPCQTWSLNKTAWIKIILGMQLANQTGMSAAPYSALTLYWYTTELQYGPTGLNHMVPDEDDHDMDVYPWVHYLLFVLCLFYR
jgi:hypothetical protein